MLSTNTSYTLTSKSLHDPLTHTSLGISCFNCCHYEINQLQCYYDKNRAIHKLYLFISKDTTREIQILR